MLWGLKKINGACRICINPNLSPFPQVDVIFLAVSGIPCYMLCKYKYHLIKIKLDIVIYLSYIILCSLTYWAGLSTCIYMCLHMKGYTMNKPFGSDAKPETETPLGNRLGSVKFYTTKFESTAIRQQLLDGLGKDEANSVIAQHKITGEFDFTGVTVVEITTFLCSTTSVLKQYQNNMMNMKEEAILILAGETQTISVREMLDTTKTRTAGKPSIEKTVDKMKKAGDTNDDIRKVLEAQLAMLTK